MIRRTMLLVEEEDDMGWTTDGIADRSEPNGDITIGIAKIGNFAFYNCKGITGVSGNNVTDIGANGFSGCELIANVSLPNLVRLGQNSFAYSKITELEIPKIGSIGLEYGALTKMESLEKVDVGIGLTKTTGTAFSGCKNLKTLILRRTNSIVALSNVNDFTGTPFASGGTGGTIYVPESLIEDYKVATNWADIYALGTLTFAPIEGSEYE